MKNLILRTIGLSTLTIGLTASMANADEYAGSSFSEVWNVVQNGNLSLRTPQEKNEFAVYQTGLPQYPVNAKSLFASGPADLERDAKRTVNERFDYYDYLPKRLHPNGVCAAGEWQITAQTPYSGMLASGKKGLFIGRISVAMEETKVGSKRGFGIEGKVFPTQEVNEPVHTGNFFTVDVLLGTKLKNVLDSTPTNEPETGFDLSLVGLGLKIGSALSTADENPTFRPLTQLANPNGNTTEAIVQPKWIRLTADKNIKRNSEKDFRTEVVRTFSENQTIKYFIEVSDTTSDRTAKTGWTRIGEINLNQAIISYGCDRRLHFAHPKLK